MYFDFEDYRPDISPIEHPISGREGVLLSVFVHAAIVLFLLFGPRLPAGHTAALAARQAALQQQRDREASRFVFVSPRLDLAALEPKPRAENSDKNRLARTRERAPHPTNEMPFARGNSTERVEASPAPRGNPQEAPPAGARDAGGGDRELETMPREVESPSNSALTSPLPRAQPRGDAGTGASAPGALGEALRNLQRYVQQDAFDNPQGGAGAFGPSIQFDTKGVEFGPWIRRFIAQIKRNWFIPYAAMSMKGHVVMTFYVHKDGTISGLAVQGPSAIDAFNNAAYNALTSSNPTQPLPPEYPSDQAFFTVTFYYNEPPP